MSRPFGVISSFLEDINRRGLSCKHILDVGANMTQWSRMTASIFPAAAFYLIEPLVEMEPYLKKFCADFPGSKYFLKGAGPEEKILNLTVSNYLPESNFVITIEEYDNPEINQREINVITIDSLIRKKEIEIPELVKLDIQGFELEALEGANMLFGVTEAFILEVSLFKFHKQTPAFLDVIKFMDERGYEVYDFPGFLHRPFDGALGQVDICFARKNGLLRASNAW